MPDHNFGVGLTFWQISLSQPNFQSTRSEPQPDWLRFLAIPKHRDVRYSASSGTGGTACGFVCADKLFSSSLAHPGSAIMSLDASTVLMVFMVRPAMPVNHRGDGVSRRGLAW